MDETVTTSGRTPAVNLKQVTRRFGAVQALARIDLEVPRGAVFALVGRNGAGKTTTFRIVAGLSRADEGMVEVLGHDLDRAAGRAAARGASGVVPDFCPLFEPLTVRENARALGRFRGLSREVLDARLEELAAALGAEGILDRPVAGLSHGQRKQAALIVAMLHAAELLLLDEPFAGLDPISVRAICRLVSELRRRGVTVFVTSHALSLVERIATHVAVIDSGRVLDAGPLEQVASGSGLEQRVLAVVGREHPLPSLAWYRR